MATNPTDGSLNDAYCRIVEHIPPGETFDPGKTDKGHYGAIKRLYEKFDGVPYSYSFFNSCIRRLADMGYISVEKPHARDAKSVTVVKAEPPFPGLMPGPTLTDRVVNYLALKGGELKGDPYTEVVEPCGFAHRNAVSSTMGDMRRDGLIEVTGGGRGGTSVTAIRLTDKGMKRSLPYVRSDTQVTVEDEGPEEPEPIALRPATQVLEPEPELEPDDDMDYDALARVLLKHALQAMLEGEKKDTGDKRLRVKVRSLQGEVSELKRAYGIVKQRAEELLSERDHHEREAKNLREEKRMLEASNERLQQLIAEAGARDQQTADDIRQRLPKEQRRKLAELKKEMERPPSAR